VCLFDCQDLVDPDNPALNIDGIKRGEHPGDMDPVQLPSTLHDHPLLVSATARKRVLFQAKKGGRDNPL